MSKILNVILGIVIVLLVSYIVYDKVLVKENKNGNIIDHRDNINTKYYSYSDEQNTYSLYLYDDKSYYFGVSTDSSNISGSIGKYEIKNDKLLLKEEKYSNGDSCYYTDTTKVISFDYHDNSIIDEENRILTISTYDGIYPIVDVELIDGIRNCTN